MQVSSPQQLPRIVVVGGGFAGLEVARRLRKSPVDVTLVDRHNYHLFQPLLYQVATGGLSPANIATPLRSIVRKQPNCEVLLAEVVDFDVNHQRVVLADGELKYDKLVLAAGATHSYFGNDHWEQFAPGLKTVSDAAEIRRRIYVAFEAAERETDAERRRALMTFVVVGGGPTGVELAGALSEVARHTLKNDFRHINPGEARILIVEAAPHILSHYPDDLCQKAAKKVRDLGIEVHTATMVTEITADLVRLQPKDGEEQVIMTETVLWGAGVAANPLGKKLADSLGLEADRAGRLPVNENCQIAGHDDIFVIGDIAKFIAADGNPLPGLASVAVQQGAYVAKAITSQIKTGMIAKPFVYSDKGTMATIGRASAVAEIGKFKFCGWFAWILWLFIHLMLIVQFQNRVLILLQWAWNYMTFNRSNRIILGDEPFSHLHSDSDSASHSQVGNTKKQE